MADGLAPDMFGVILFSAKCIFGLNLQRIVVIFAWSSETCPSCSPDYEVRLVSQADVSFTNDGSGALEDMTCFCFILNLQLKACPRTVPESLTGECLQDC